MPHNKDELIQYFKDNGLNRQAKIIEDAAPHIVPIFNSMKGQNQSDPGPYLSDEQILLTTYIICVMLFDN